LSSIPSVQLDDYLSSAIKASKIAGEKIMQLYGHHGNITTKFDGSPLTIADLESHGAIIQELQPLGIPIVSEEDEARKQVNLYTRYWLIDPLDGTKDFLAKNDEFTINIALVENGRPIIGVVYAPALNELYYGSIYRPAIKIKNGLTEIWHLPPKRMALKMAISRFHDCAESADFAIRNQIQERIPMGASLKYVKIAFGEIDVYPRMVGTSEWDTAAGQAILESVRGGMYDMSTYRPIAYGKHNFRNGKFLAFRFPYEVTDFIW